METLDKLGVLKKYFGYDGFREGQEDMIDGILRGQDVLGVMPTGAGKSICYQVPALMMEGITLVISPLISLMKDQVQSLNQAGVHAAYINSSLTESQIMAALRFAAEGRYKIIYVAPERLETYDFLAFAQRTRISMVTVDEAHCISQWGQDFRPSYLKIVQFIHALGERPVISAFTATATANVREDIVCVLGLRQPKILVTGFDRGNLFFSVETVKHRDSYVEGYVREHAGESGIIYCATRKNVDALFGKLSAQGVPVARYHAGLSGEERRESQDAFLYDRSLVMVATNAFGMGIDKSNVRYVLHYNMPQSLENYYQEAGRAGRDGEAAECVLLYSAQDIMINRILLSNKGQNPDFTWEEAEAIRERDEARLRTMQYYCLTKGCLREYILRYFGEKGAAECGNCSNCRKEFEEVDVTEEAGKIIGCIFETRQRYGINVIAGTLRGDGRAKLREYGMPAYPSFGSLKGMAEAEIKRLIDELLVEGLLSATNDKFALLKVTRAGMEVREGSRRVIVRRPKGDPAREEASAGKMERGPGRRSDLLNTKGLDLFDRLKGLRTAIAREEGLPPYIIFSDKTLTDMCVKVPLSREEMLHVNGVGENKLRRYGERFLREIQEFTGGTREKLSFGGAGELPGYAAGADAWEGAYEAGADAGKRAYAVGADAGKRAYESGSLGMGGRGGTAYPAGAGGYEAGAGKGSHAAGAGSHGTGGWGSTRDSAGRPHKAEFGLTAAQAEHFPYAERYLVTEIAERLSELRDPETMKKVTGAEIFRRLVAKGLVSELRVDGRWKRLVSEEGAAAGLSVGMRMSRKGTEYEDVYYDERAQRMIVGWFVRE